MPYNTYIVSFHHNGHNIQMSVIAVSQVDAILTVERMFPGANVLAVVLK
jgi:hypothetical protein